VDGGKAQQGQGEQRDQRQPIILQG
jgi:hypothetical protein